MKLHFCPTIIQYFHWDWEAEMIANGLVDFMSLTKISLESHLRFLNNSPKSCQFSVFSPFRTRSNNTEITQLDSQYCMSLMLAGGILVDFHLWTAQFCHIKIFGKFHLHNNYLLIFSILIIDPSCKYWSIFCNRRWTNLNI